ncbi:MAG: hypothetical protein AB2556_12870, partial [Candidatus Thiodiazotropha sp.]
MCIPCLLKEKYLLPVAPAQWRDKGEKICMPQEHADYRTEPAWVATKKNLTPSTTPRRPAVFTPTHRLAKEMQARGAKAQTYHSFFRWSGQTEWT